MTVEERLTTHFKTTSEGLSGPGGEIGTIMNATTGLSKLSKVLLGTGATVIGLGFILSFIVPAGTLSAQDSVQQLDEPREVISPFLRVPDRIETQSDVELFTVTSDTPSYWRIATLNDYNVEQASWQVRADFNRLGPDTFEARDDGLTIKQEFEIKNLQAIWLPAAPEPVEVNVSTDQITWSAETSTLSVPNDLENSDGLRYTVVSKLPMLTQEQLRDAPPFVSGMVDDDYLFTEELPVEVGQLAREITDGHDTNYDKMKALQDHFRGYSYTMDDLRQPDTDPLVHFLKEQEGFSQDFSGTFALMVRELGLPSRVAVGFTSGEPISNNPDGTTTFSVKGQHAHAWPEVYFDGIGWVGFEPTPDRAIPGAESYAGVAFGQDAPNIEADE